MSNLRGNSDIHGFFVGTWYMREDIREILNYMINLAELEGNQPQAKKLLKVYNYLDEIEATENLYK